MRLAVIGGTSRATRRVIRHGKRTGYKVSAPRGLSAVTKAVNRSDAVLCLLHDLDENMHQTVKYLLKAMKTANVKRLVLFSFLAKDHFTEPKPLSLLKRLKKFFKREVNHFEAMLSTLKRSGLDWTLVGWPSNGQVDPPEELAKHMIGQLTDVTNLQRVFVLPNSGEEA